MAMSIYRRPSFVSHPVKEVMLLCTVVVFCLQFAAYCASFFSSFHVSTQVGFLTMSASLLPFILAHQAIKDNPLVRSKSERSGQESFSLVTLRQREMWLTLPRWFRYCVALVGIFVVTMFVVSFVEIGHYGNPEFRGGTYWAGNYKTGMPYRMISADEYWRLEGHRSRWISGVGILISGVSTVAFVWDRRRKKGVPA